MQIRIATPQPTTSGAGLPEILAMETAGTRIAIMAILTLLLENALIYAKYVHPSIFKERIESC